MKAFHGCTTVLLLAAATALPAVAHPAPAGLTAADRSFLSDTGTANQKEIDVSKMAEQQGQSQAVRSFATTMVTDHTQLGATMKAKFGDAVSPMSSPPPPELSGKTGHDFDKAYIDLMVSDHDMFVDKFKQAATGDDHSAAVHHAAMNALPTLKHHDEMAKSLDARL
jgi:putative membrane protein